MVDDLEKFEILQACYPDKFRDEDDDSWDAAQEYIEDEKAWDLIERLLMVCGEVMESELTGKQYRVFGKDVETISGKSTMKLSLIKREI